MRRTGNTSSPPSHRNGTTASGRVGMAKREAVKQHHQWCLGLGKASCSHARKGGVGREVWDGPTTRDDDHGKDKEGEERRRDLPYENILDE